MRINFQATTAEDILDNTCLTSLDFIRDGIERGYAVTLIGYADDCGPAEQDGMVFEIDGRGYALLTNGCTVYADELDELDELGPIVRFDAGNIFLSIDGLTGNNLEDDRTRGEQAAHDVLKGRGYAAYLAASANDWDGDGTELAGLWHEAEKAAETAFFFGWSDRPQSGGVSLTWVASA